MATGNACAACGCAILAEDVRSGKCCRFQGLLYCRECSALLVEPSSQPAPKTLLGNIDISEAGTSPSMPALGGKPGGNGAPVEVLEEWEIHVEGKEPEEEAKGSAGPEPAAAGRGKRFARNKAGGASPGRPQSRASGRSGGPGRDGKPARGPSARLQSASGRASGSRRDGSGAGGEAKPQIAGVPANRKGSEREILYRSSKVSSVGEETDGGDGQRPARVSASGRNGRPSSRKMIAAPKPAEKISSRQMPTAPKSSERRISSRIVPAEEGRLSGRTRRSLKDDMLSGKNAIYAYVGGGILLAVLVLAVTLGGGAIAKKRAKPKEEGQVPASGWVQRAEQAKREGKTLEARDYYLKAAEAAQQAGDTRTAEAYAREAYTLQKFTPVDMRK